MPDPRVGPVVLTPQRDSAHAQAGRDDRGEVVVGLYRVEHRVDGCQSLLGQRRPDRRPFALGEPVVAPVVEERHPLGRVPGVQARLPPAVALVRPDPGPCAQMQHDGLGGIEVPRLAADHIGEAQVLEPRRDRVGALLEHGCPGRVVAVLVVPGRAFVGQRVGPVLGRAPLLPGHLDFVVVGLRIGERVGLGLQCLPGLGGGVPELGGHRVGCHRPETWHIGLGHEGARVLGGQRGGRQCQQRQRRQDGRSESQ